MIPKGTRGQTLSFMLIIQLNHKAILNTFMTKREQLMRSKWIVLVFLLCIGEGLSGQAPPWDWVKSLHTGGHEAATDVAADPVSGNLYVTGYWKDDLSGFIPAGSSPNTDFSTTFGGDDGLVAKYTPAGDLIWAFKVGGDGNDMINAIHLDNEGNFYITGFVETGDIHFAGRTSLAPDSSYVNASHEDFFISKYDPDGRLLWFRHSEGDDKIEGRGICSNTSGIFVTGMHQGTVSFGVLPPYTSAGNEDMFIVNYSVDGTEEWHISGSSNRADFGEDMVCDEASLYVVGEFAGDALSLTNSSGAIMISLPNSNSSKAEIYVAAYGQDGNLEWAETVISPEDDFCQGITMDTDTLYLAGSLGAQAMFPSYTGNPVIHVDKQDAFACSLSKDDGTTGWVTRFSGETGDDQVALDISRDLSGNLYVTGYYKNTLNTPVGDLSSIGNVDLFLASLNHDGINKWIQTAGSSGADLGHGISASAPGFVYMAGEYEKEIFFDTLSAPDDGSVNLFLAGLKLPCVDPVGGFLSASDSEVCESDTQTLVIEDYVGNIEWQSSPPGMNAWSLLTADLSDSITFEPATTADYRAYLTAGTCPPDSSNVVQVVVHPKPSATLSGDTVRCDDGTPTPLQVELTGTPPWDIVIQHNGVSDSVINGIPASPYFHEVTEPGSYAVVSVLDAHCTGKVSGSATLDYFIPPAGHLSGDTTLCGPNPVTLYLSLAGDGPWDISYSDSTTESGIANIGSPIYPFPEFPTKSTHYFLTKVTDSHGCTGTLSGEAFVQMDTIRISNPGSDSEICGLDYALFAADSDSGYWSFNSGPGTASFSPDSTDPAAMASVSMYGNYLFTWREINGICYDDSSVSVTFDEPPSPDPGPGGEVCGLSYALGAVPGTGLGVWSLDSGPGTAIFSPSADDPSAVVTVSDFGDYQLLWTENDGTCIRDSSVIVRFFELPVITLITEIRTCGLEYRLNAVSNLDLPGLWSVVTSPGNVAFLPNEGAADAMIQVDAYGIYSFQWTVLNVACTQLATVDIEFLKPPDADAGMDITIEAGESIQLHGTPGDSVIWAPDYQLSDPTIPDPWADPLVTTLYYLKVINSEGCAAKDSVLITVIPPDFARAGEDVAICFGDSIQLNASGGDSYRWEPVEGLVWSDIADPWVKPSLTTSYVVFVIRSDGVEDSDTVTVTVLPKPFLDAGESQSICLGEKALLSATGTGTFSWIPTEGFSNPSIPVTEVKVDTTTTFLVRMTDPQGCRNADTVTVFVYPPPVADAGSDQEYIGIYETYLEASLGPNEKGAWSVIDGHGIFQSPQEPGTFVSGLEIGDNIFNWQVTNSVCPEVSDQVLIRIHDFVIPTVITPNGDGKNDHFVVNGILEYHESELIVLNRWGEVVYQVAPYENNWEGSHQNGRELLEGTYYIILKITDQDIRKETVLIVR